MKRKGTRQASGSSFSRWRSEKGKSRFAQTPLLKNAIEKNIGDLDFHQLDRFLIGKVCERGESSIKRFNTKIVPAISVLLVFSTGLAIPELQMTRP